MSESRKPTDKAEIQNWAKEHVGVPAIIKGTKNEGQGEGVLRIHFPKRSQNI